jgi:hypothetical protein
MKQQLMLVAMLSVGTALTTIGRLKPVAASVTPPATYDYSYTWNAGASEQYLNVNGVDSIPLYTRTADGVYWNYTNTTTVIDGILVTTLFNRSTSTWQASGAYWKPDENRIGSNNTVGTIGNKVKLTFTNNTNNDYLLNLDVSSSPDHYWSHGFVPYQDVAYYIYSGASLLPFLLPSHTEFVIYYRASSFPVYFDAWYLKDLGISEAYQQGLDAESDGILTDYLGTDAQQIGWVLIGIAVILFAFKGGK